MKERSCGADIILYSWVHTVCYTTKIMYSIQSTSSNTVQEKDYFTKRLDENHSETVLVVADEHLCTRGHCGYSEQRPALQKNGGSHPQAAYGDSRLYPRHPYSAAEKRSFCRRNTGPSIRVLPTPRVRICGTKSYRSTIEIRPQYLQVSIRHIRDDCIQQKRYCMDCFVSEIGRDRFGVIRENRGRKRATMLHRADARTETV